MAQVSIHQVTLCFAAHDPVGLARFWGGVLGRKVVDDGHDGIALVPEDDTELQIRFLPTLEEKRGPNQAHFDLTSASEQEMDARIARALELGGAHIDVGQRPEEGHAVLADPEGNEFCVIPPGNGFLSDTGTIGALSSDGTQAVGYFWAEALGWPLVWDQDEETAIQSPRGGTKVTWGGPPVAPKWGRNRMHLDLYATGADDVDRLVALGASRLGSAASGRVPMADPDGNELCVVLPA
ncbi:VOC family protein [Nocardioides rotundus]|nr:VOC family protein [Nocardioides rotundus]